jgi:hypothetical protein
MPSPHSAARIHKSRFFVVVTYSAHNMYGGAALHPDYGNPNGDQLPVRRPLTSAATRDRELADEDVLCAPVHHLCCIILYSNEARSFRIALHPFSYRRIVDSRSPIIIVL